MMCEKPHSPLATARQHIRRNQEETNRQHAEILKAFGQTRSSAGKLEALSLWLGTSCQGKLKNRRVEMHRRNPTPSPFSTFLWPFSSASSAGSCSWWEKVWALVIRLLSVEYPTAVMQYDYRSLKGKWLVELVDFKSIQLFLSVWHNICKSSWLVESLVKPEGDFSYIILVMACSGWWDGELILLRWKACVHWSILQALVLRSEWGWATRLA